MIRFICFYLIIIVLISYICLQEDLGEHVVQGDVHPGHVGTACLLSSTFYESGKDNGVVTLPIMGRNSRQTIGKVRGKIWYKCSHWLTMMWLYAKGREGRLCNLFLVFLCLSVHTLCYSVLVDYLVIRPIQGLHCDMSSSFTKYWKKRSTLDVGHRGAGSTHAAKWVLTTVFNLDRAPNINSLCQ